MAGGWKREEVQAGRRRKDDEVLFDNRRKESEAPWLVISHDGKDLLIDILRQVVITEVSKAVQEAFNLSNQYIPTAQEVTTYQELGREEVKALLKNKTYGRSLRWTREIDTELILAGIHNYQNRGVSVMMYKDFAEQFGFSYRAVEHRWLSLRHYLQNVEEENK